MPMSVDKPLYLANSLQELVNEHTESLEIDKSFKIYHYLCTSNNLIKQASIYKSEGDIEKAYIYLLRFCILAIEKLPNHPEYNDTNFSRLRDSLKKDAISKLGELEDLKKTLVERYRQMAQQREKEAERKQLELEQKRAQEELKREEKRLKEEKDKLAQKDLLESQELEREIQRIYDRNEELASFHKRKTETEKKIRQSRFNKQAELLRLEALALKEQEQQQNSIEDDKVTTEPIPQEEQKQIDDKSVNKEFDNNTISTPTAINLDSDELMAYLEKSKEQKLNIDKLPNQSSNFLVDPDLAPPPVKIAPQTTPTTITPTPNIIKSQSISPNNIPTTYGGYPSFQQLQQQQQQQQPPQYFNNTNKNGYAQPPQYPYNQQPQNNVHQIPPPQYNYNNNKFTPPQYPFTLPFNNVQQQQLPVHLNSPNLLQNQLKLPLNPSQILHNHQFPSPPIHSTPQTSQTPTTSSYLSNIQQQKLVQHQQPSPPPINTTGIVGSAIQNTNLSSQIPSNQKPKTNIDSPEASKKYSKLRKIIINGEILNEFMRMADSNTRRSIETCGILSGSLSNDVFKVTTLIIPKQEGTSDTCNTVDEHEIFEFQLENDLLTLGWIHTHPTQDCFLSAVDVHTHCSYQYLLPEAVAIVMSPRANPNFGIFRLTDPPGIQTVQKCKLKSFHPHPPVNGIPIYTKSEHVDLIWGKNDSKVVDLRNVKKK